MIEFVDASVKEDKRFAMLRSSDWGVWSREKVLLNEAQQLYKHRRSAKVLREQLANAPERMQLALRYTYGLTNLDAYATPITDSEYRLFLSIYHSTQDYVTGIDDEGLRFLVSELRYIQLTAEAIPGFREGQLVNETKDPTTWRKYVALDFFKFSCINILIRTSLEDVFFATDSMVAGRFVLASFLGCGSYTEKASVLFSDKAARTIRKLAIDLANKIELTTEYPDVNYQNYENQYFDLHAIISSERLKNDDLLSFRERFVQVREMPKNLCNDFYNRYFHQEVSDYTEQQLGSEPLAEIFRLSISDLPSESASLLALTKRLRFLRSQAHSRYYDPTIFPCRVTAKNYVRLTNHPYFKLILYECKLLGRIVEQEQPTWGRQLRPVFEDLIPFLAPNYEKTGHLLDKNILAGDLPLLVLAHHVHHANCETTFRKMAINKLVNWDQERIIHNVSSSSRDENVVLAERHNCLALGFNHYRIHARQHLKAGNQNRAFFNAIDGVGTEYYLTMDDDFFAFPDFGLVAHTKITAKNLDYFQSVNAFNGVYEQFTVAEKADAEIMHSFETTLGYTYPRLFTFPRGTSTVFCFRDGKNSLSDTGGFLVDFSCEDFGQGCLSMIQRISGNDVYGKATVKASPGEISPDVHCIGEGVDLQGKLKQIERWSHGSAKVLFHLMLPAFLKGVFRGSRINWQFSGTYLLFLYSMLARVFTLLLFISPFVIGHVAERVNSDLTKDFQFNWLIPVVIISNLSVFALQIFNTQQRVSLAPVRIFFLDVLVNAQALRGFLKGLIGITPKSWAADKSRKNARNLMRANYIILIAAVFTLLSDSWLGSAAHYFPIAFIVAVIAGGIYHVSRKPALVDWQRYVELDTLKKMWTYALIANCALNVLFFALEFSTHPDVFKSILLLALALGWLLNIIMSVVYNRILELQRQKCFS